MRAVVASLLLIAFAACIAFVLHDGREGGLSESEVSFKSQNPYPHDSQPSRRPRLVGAAAQTEHKWHQTLGKFFGDWTSATGSSSALLDGARTYYQTSHDDSKFPFGEDKEVNGKLLASARVGEKRWKDTVSEMQNGLLEQNSKVLAPYERHFLAAEKARHQKQERLIKTAAASAAKMAALH